MRLEMKPLISHLNPAQCSAHARLSSYGAMIEILNIIIEDYMSRCNVAVCVCGEEHESSIWISAV